MWISLVLSFSKKFINIRVSSIDAVIYNTGTERGKEPGSIVILSSGQQYEVDEACSVIMTYLSKQKDEPTI